MLFGNFAEMTTSTPFRDLLHAANLRHGADGFTSPLKEGVLRIFLNYNIIYRYESVTTKFYIKPTYLQNPMLSLHDKLHS